MAAEERGLGRGRDLEWAHGILGVLVHADRRGRARQGLRLCISASSQLKVMLPVRGPHFKQHWERAPPAALLGDSWAPLWAPLGTELPRGL